MRVGTRGWGFVYILLGITARFGRGAEHADTPAAAPQTFTVTETYNQSPFEYQMKLLAQRDGFRVYRLTYPSPTVTAVEPNNTVCADYYLPDNLQPGDSRRPAVITLHILNGDMRVTDVACSVLAKRGIPAIMPTLPYYGPRAKAEGFRALLNEPRLFLNMLLQSVEDVRRTVDLLVSRSEVDPQRIDLSGVSLGGIVAASAAAAEPRVYRTAMFLAGGDLLEVLHHARYTRELSARFRQLPADERADIEARVVAIDPLQMAPKLRERAEEGRVLMVNAADDEIIPRACTEKLAAALGIGDKVVWIDGLKHHTFIAALPEALERITAFFAQDLPADVVPQRTAAVDPSTPLQRAASLVQQALALLTTEPDAGHAHLLEATIMAEVPSQEPNAIHFRLVRGAARKFTLSCRLPGLGELTLGQHDFPWMVTAGKSVMRGVKNPLQDHNPLGFADPSQLAKLRAVGGIIGTLDLVPDVLGQWVHVEDVKTENISEKEKDATAGSSAVRIATTERGGGSVLISFQNDGQTPSEAAYKVAGIDGKATVRAWKLNAVLKETAFDPPGDLPGVDVDQADLYRTFATLFNLAMQRAQ